MVTSLVAELSASGLSFRVVGGSTEADVDIVVTRSEVPRLLVALGAVGTPDLPSPGQLVAGRPCRVRTALGPLDVFVES